MKLNPLSRYSFLPILFILIVGVIVYSNSFQVPFVLDDDSSIVRNETIRDLRNYYAGSLGYETSPNRFVAYLTFALNYRIGGLDVAGYHVVNLLIHLASALLVYALLRLTFRTPYFRDAVPSPKSKAPGLTPHSSLLTPNSFIPGLTPHPSLLTPYVFIPLFAALLFVAHPVQTQAVTYIVQRMTSLATMFYLLSVVLYVWGRLRLEEPGARSREPGEKARAKSNYLKAGVLIAGSVLSAILAMKTKEIAFTLPFAVLLFEIFFFPGTWKRRLLYLLPVMATLPIIPITVLSIGESSGNLLSDVSEQSRVETDISRFDYLFTQFRVIVTYLRLLVLPINQNLDYDYPIFTTFFTPPVFLSFLLLAAIFGFALWIWWCNSKFKIQNSKLIPRLLGFSILWFFLTISVESTLIPIADVIFEHRLYLPSVGAFTAFAAGFHLVSEKIKAAKLSLPIAVLLVLGLSFATYQRNLVWGDDVHLWQDVVNKSPQKVRVYNNLGVSLTDSGRPWEAIEVLSQAIKVDPLHPHAYNNLGRAYILTDQSSAAVPVLKKAIQLHLEYDDAFINLAAALNQQRQFREAANLLEQNMRLLAGRAEARYQLGVAYAYLGNQESARRELDILSRLNPNLASHLASLLR